MRDYAGLCSNKQCADQLYLVRSVTVRQHGNIDLLVGGVAAMQTAAKQSAAMQTATKQTAGKQTAAKQAQTPA